MGFKQLRARFLVAGVLAFLGIARAQTATETILHSFGYFPQGDSPCGTLVRDGIGNLYGTAFYGGQANLGVVFEWQPSGGYRVLHSFLGGIDGANPYAGVILDAKGNLYGTTYAGGGASAGTVYEISSSGEERVLYTFTGGADGSHPYAPVAMDDSGNLYGTTFGGGTANAGVVYKLDPSGQQTVLYTFSGGADGANPYAGVVLDPQGNLYGTTSGGDPVFGGLVYKVSPSGQETVIYNHLGLVQAGLIRDTSGNLYGTNSAYVFKLSPSGQYTELAYFNENVDGGSVTSALTMDAAGNLYGTTASTTLSQEESPNGEVFEVIPGAMRPKVLYRFPAYPAYSGIGGQLFDINNPGLVLDAAGTLYGVTQDISLGGAIYELTASGTETVLYRFPPAPGGSTPYGPVIQDLRGNIYGVSGNGGPVNEGVLYELTSSGEKVLPPNPGTVGNSLARDRQGNLYVAGGDNRQVPGKIYKVAPSGTSTVFYSFTGGTDGNGSRGVTVDPAGNIYGVSTGGGAPNGLVFKLSAGGKFTILYSFMGGADGSDVNYPLTLDSAGNLYGTTIYGGGGAGVVYRVTPAGQQTVLHSFNGTDGDSPAGAVTLDSETNLFGTTAGGGTMSQGVLYKISRTGVFTILHNFAYDATGASPLAGPTLDAEGNLYGTTTGGGDLQCNPVGAKNDPIGCGVVYELTGSGVYSVLHTFEGGADGATPESEVLLDGKGNLYGTAPFGGRTGSGVVYIITKK